MAMTKAEAAAIARRFVNDGRWGPSVGELVILEQFAVQTRRGWLFTYQTRAFAETGDIGSGLMGNGPVLVENDTGRAVQFPSAYGSQELARLIDAGDDSLKRWWT